MQKTSRSALTGVLAVTVLLSFVLVMPQAFAHQVALYNIGGQDYLIVIGSLNEPIYVDDKTGVDLRVVRADPNDPMNSRANGTQPVEGLEETLQVEIAAGNASRVMQLEPAFGEPGAYEAPFYPTIATTLTYRIFGTINNTDVDLTFTCSPAGEAEVADNSTVQISEGVERKGIEGGYGCPLPLSEAGFPEPYISNHEIVMALEQLGIEFPSTNATADSTTTNASMTT
jgi:hypothetical protein